MTRITNSTGVEHMAIRPCQMTRDELQALARNGKSPESRWLAARKLKLRGCVA